VRRSLLLVAQLAPPSPLIAARRAGALAKYLPRNGVEVTILTSALSGDGPVEGAVEIVRTNDLLATRLNWRRKHFAAVSGEAAGTYGPPSRLQSVLVPDPAAVSWLPFALPGALALARKRRFDCVVTTSPPQSAHTVGAALRRRGIRWIAELRDGWTFEPPRSEWPLGAQRAFDRALERRLLRAADAVVGVTQPIVDDAAGRLGVEAHLITNGFDPEEIGEAAGERGEPLLASDRFSFVHTGRVGVTGRRLGPLTDALRVLRREDPELADRIEVVFAGPLSAVEEAELGAPEVSEMVRVVGAVPRPRALRLQRAADALIVLTRGARSEATGKVFEYLAARRPILVLGDDTEAARIVSDAGAGVAVRNNVAAVAAALRDLATEARAGADGSALERYSYPSVVAQYASLIERVCGPD
jgi:glycosyltransferase involved in cell wall biosynthesis